MDRKSGLILSQALYHKNLADDVCPTGLFWDKCSMVYAAIPLKIHEYISLIGWMITMEYYVLLSLRLYVLLQNTNNNNKWVDIFTEARFRISLQFSKQAHSP